MIRSIPSWAPVAAMLLALALPAPGHANDSTAHMAAGGLVLAPTGEIQMLSEDLFVSREKIAVTYRFRNTTDRDVVTLVAFPMPELTAPFDGDISIPSDDPVNFLNFTTTVDGKPVEAKVEQRALALGIDRTDLLNSLNIPVAPHLEGTGKALDALARERQAELHQAGMIAFAEYDAGQGWERHARPLWTLKTTYYWSQTFPAGKDILVEHGYAPSVGASVQTMVGSDFSGARAMEDYRHRYCIEDGFVKAAARKQQGGKVTLTEWRIDYVLTTGANWAGTIQDFRLVVDKGAPDNLVSFCATGVKKIGPTRFEVRYQDYFPERDLQVLLLEPVRN